MYFVLILVFVCVVAEEVPYPPNCNCSHLLYSNDLSTEPTPTFPPTSFTCWGRYDGYYADIEVDCTIFHYCQTWQYPTGLNETVKWDFACPHTTIFNQRVLSCTLPNNSFDCQESPSFYWVNYNLTGTYTTPEPTTSYTNTGIGNQLIEGLIPQSGEYSGTTPATESATSKPENSENPTSGNIHSEETVSQSNSFPAATTQSPESVSLSETTVSNEENTEVIRPQSDNFPDSSFTSTSPELIPSDSSSNLPASHYPDFESSVFNTESTNFETSSQNFEDFHSPSDRFPGSTTPTAYITQVPEFIASVSSQGHLDNNFQTVQEPDSASWTTFTTPHLDSTYGASSEEDHTEGFTTQLNFYTEKETKLPNFSQDQHEPEQELTTKSSYTTPFSDSFSSSSQSDYEVDVSSQSGNLPDSSYSTPQVINQQDNDPHINQHPASNSSNVSLTPSDSPVEASEALAPTPGYELNEESTSPTDNYPYFTFFEEYSTQSLENYDNKENNTSGHITESGIFIATDTTAAPELTITNSDSEQDQTKEPQLDHFPDSSNFDSSSGYQQNDSRPDTSFTHDFTTVAPDFPIFDTSSEHFTEDSTTLNPELVESNMDYNSEFSVSESDQEAYSLLQSTTLSSGIVPHPTNSISNSENYTQHHAEKPDFTTISETSDSEFNSEHNILDSEEQQTGFLDAATSLSDLVQNSTVSVTSLKNNTEQRPEMPDTSSSNPMFDNPDPDYNSPHNISESDQQQPDPFLVFTTTSLSDLVPNSSDSGSGDYSGQHPEKPDQTSTNLEVESSESDYNSDQQQPNTFLDSTTSLPDLISAAPDSSSGNYTVQHPEKPDTASSNPMFDNPDPDYNSPHNFSESDQQQLDPFLVLTTLFPDHVSSSSDSVSGSRQNFNDGYSTQPDFTSNSDVITPKNNHQRPNFLFGSSTLTPDYNKHILSTEPEELKPKSQSYTNSPDFLTFSGDTKESNTPKLNPSKGLDSSVLGSGSSVKEPGFTSKKELILETTSWTSLIIPESTSLTFTQLNSKDLEKLSLTTSAPLKFNSEQPSYPPDSVKLSNFFTSELDKDSSFESTSKPDSSTESVSSHFSVKSSDDLIPPANYLLPPFYSDPEASQLNHQLNHSKSHNSTSLVSSSVSENLHNSSASPISLDNPKTHYPFQVDSQSQTHIQETFSGPTHTPDSTITSLTRIVSGIISSDEQKPKKFNPESIHFPQPDSVSSDRDLEHKPSVKHNLQSIIFPQ